MTHRAWASLSARTASANPGATGPAARAAALAIGAWALVMLAVTILAHPTPLYFVETDLIGEYIPAARELLSGHLTAAHYTYKGPGYPALLALFMAGGGDGFLAARVLGVLAAAIAAWLGFVLVLRRSGARVAGIALAITLLAPAFVRYTIEAGTDMPALALMLGATLLALDAKRAPQAACAGLLAGAAILTRGNAVFLIPAAAWALFERSRVNPEPNQETPHESAAMIPPLKLRSPSLRALKLGAYVAGCAVPLAIWAIACARAGVVIHDRNYLNIAYELYGRDLPWGAFETTIGARFTSLAQVVSYDPLHAAGRVATNLIAHRGRDLTELIPVWLGLFAVPGFVLLARERAWRAALLGPVLCAVALAAVFYNPRFALYLLPFYAAAAALALVRAAAWAIGRAPRLAVLPRAVAGAMLTASAAAAVIGIAGPLALAPHEARRAGATLAGMGERTDGVLARKPHAAHFAGMRYVPMPETESLFELLHRARAARAQWLFFSACERANRPQFAVLADSAVRLPGLEPVAWDATPGHDYALYRIAATTADSAQFASQLAGVTQRYETRHRDDPEALLFAALQWNALGRHDDALRCLDDLLRRGANDARVEQVRADAHLALGQLDSAAVACERALSMAPPLASRWGRLGEIRARQRRFAEARRCYQQAVGLEPAHIAWLERLGLAHLELGEPRAAAAAFDRCVRLAPRNVMLRRYAMGAWQLAGDGARVATLLDEGTRLGMDRAALLGAETAPASTGGR